MKRGQSSMVRINGEWKYPGGRPLSDLAISKEDLINLWALAPAEYECHNPEGGQLTLDLIDLNKRSID